MRTKDEEKQEALFEATGIEYPLVRVRAAVWLAAFPKMTAPPAYQAQLTKANEEYLASMSVRPDQWTSPYNMGNYLLSQSGADICQTALLVDETQVHSGVSFSNSQLFGDVIVILGFAVSRT